MAYIGLQHVVAAQLDTETDGSAPTYESGGMVIGKAIAANLTLNRNDNPLYADDAEAENDNGVVGGTIEINIDDLSVEARKFVLGEEEVTTGTGNSATKEYWTTEEAAPYVGIGYVRVRRKSGTTSYEALWYPKVQFGENNENANTKGQQIEWQTPTISGRIMGVRPDSSLKAKYRVRKAFETLADAMAWIDAKANVTTATTTTT